MKEKINICQFHQLCHYKPFSDGEELGIMIPYLHEVKIWTCLELEMLCYHNKQ